jgi:hypothetical protein
MNLEILSGEEYKILQLIIAAIKNQAPYLTITEMTMECLMMSCREVVL